MPDEIVKVDGSAVQVALGSFAANVRQRGALLGEIAAGMLVSVRRTFREQGSPEGSWAPLAESTLRKKPNGPGRKILIVSGRLLNSIQAQATDTGIEIGTNLVYAAVQQFGSADRGAGEGPQAKIDGRGVAVPEHTRARATGKKLGKGLHEVVDKNGRIKQVRANIQGPLAGSVHQVSAHTRYQNIPARPYLVVRPEDPARIQAQVIAFGTRAAVQAGLNTSGGAR